MFFFVFLLILFLFFFCLFFLFFQAEDGIRDLVRSRGVGDVYKRQIVNRSEDEVAEVTIDLTHLGRAAVVTAQTLSDPDPVSYTHLTLPTTDLV